jgi:protocatechuate 3,4-dioxygenase beta subunit
MKRKLNSSVTSDVLPRSRLLSLASRLLWILGATLSAGAWFLLGNLWLEKAALTPPRLAQANGGLSGVITQTTPTDFSQSCAVLPAVQASPVFTSVNLISTAGGELRLIPTFQDYFDGDSVNSALWQLGPVRNWFSVPITVSGGVVTLNGNYLRSQNAFSQSIRFFEARALLRPDPVPLPGWPDVGYMREGQLVGDTYQPALPATADTGSRVYIARGDFSQLELWARDGVEANPLIIENLGDQNLSQWRVFGVEWDVDANATRIYLDGALQRTLTATSVVTSWAWLYHPSPNVNPVQADWVRAGQYPAGGGYLSCVQDAGGTVNWSDFNATATTPVSTTLAYRTRTSLDGAAWSPWSQPLTSTLITSPSGRYFQYQVEFSNTTPLRSPELQEVVVNYFGPTLLQISPNPANLNPGATQQFTAQAFDANNRPVTGLTYTWQLPASGGGVLNATGMFTAQLAAGTFPNAISATTPITGVGPLVGYRTVTVLDLPPVASANGPYTVNQGVILSHNGSGSDPNQAGPLSFAWDLNNDSLYERPGQSITNTWLNAGVFTIGLIVTDTGNLTTTVTTTVTVNNVAPTITTITRSPTTLNQGETTTVTVTATDPGAGSDPLTYAFDCNDDGTYEIGPQASNQAGCVMRLTGLRTIRVRVTDSNGAPVTGTTTVTVNNVAPTIVSLTNSGPINEGSVVTITLTATDPGGLNDPLTYAFDCNNDGNYEVGPQSGNQTTCVFGDNGVYSVRGRVADQNGGSANATTEVTVLNVLPIILAITNNGPRLPSDPITIQVTATDPAGVNDPLQYEFDCDGDSVYELGPQMSAAATCTYSGVGDFTVNVRVADDSGSTTGSTSVSVVSVLRVFLPLIVR